VNPEQPETQHNRQVDLQLNGAIRMRVLGVDPGIAHTGYGVVDVDQRGKITYLTSGSISTSSSVPFVERLAKIHHELDVLFKELRPQHMVVEEVFFAQNARSALTLGQARGATLLSAALADIPVFEYAATEAKKAVCSYGGAGKRQVNAMVKALLGLTQDLPDHASDALALCICHVNSHRNVRATKHPAVGRKGRFPGRQRAAKVKRKRTS